MQNTTIYVDDIFRDLKLIQQQAPLIHNITNYVVMNYSANALLAIGASPIMAHAQEELTELLMLAKALVLNIGTLDTNWINSMYAAAKSANQHGIPIILDPVGAGASTLRTQTALTLLQEANIAVIRGNASEILALAGNTRTTKGVDSTVNSDNAITAAPQLARQFGCSVIISGAIDYCINTTEMAVVETGNYIMTKVTGMGCTASAMIGAFLAVNNNALQASAHAMTVMGMCGELAASQTNGPGTFALSFIDALANLH